ncbi:hypothetical protein [Pandoraea sputorum]|uniref:Phage tail protein n=1 Tax=Pandoraea sputorum TaxID=93222 RepID=A0A239SVN3_9BURK|nr:hypothetical protein [Pandoraea sputorum]AJC15147.1 hypothetical protein NA29_02180 [Pandoraea sputorum]SNU89565.1 Uncharacterised protein [Pandoraea sputorum]
MEPKTVYQTDEHGRFLYPTTAHELFLSPGKYNVPYGAVETEPPDTETGKVQKWTDGVWKLVEDNRGKSLYVVHSGDKYSLSTVVEIDGESVTYHGAGPIPAWLAETPPVVTTPLSSDE